MHYTSLFFFSAVLPAGGDAAADVPLGLVLLQDLLDLEVEAPVVDGQALLDVLM